MKTIDVDIKIREIEPYRFFEESISKLLKSLIEDFDQSMSQEVFENTYKKIAYHLKTKYKGLVWGEVEFVFNEISSGNFQDIRKVSVPIIMNCFFDYQKKRIERNRLEYEKREQQLQRNAANLHETPYGQAILFRIEQIEKGNKEWYDVPLKEIVEKIKSGEINYRYKSKRKK